MISIGFGYHGDFIMGWDEAFLQAAVDTCTNPSGNIEDCDMFTIQSEAQAGNCKFEMPDVLKDDNCSGPSDALCGNVPIQAGPEYATKLKPGGADKPDAPYTPPPASEQSLVPTLSYQAPKSQHTDEYGGGISVLRVGAEGKGKTEPADTPAATPAPATTPAPEPLKDGEGSIVGTTTYTSAGTVYEVAIQEVVKYVTVEVQQKHKHRRHVHHRRDREHGVLGHKY